LLLQEEVLKQVQETGLFKHVAAFLSSANSCCQNLPPLSHQDDFPDIAARVCCLGAEMLAGRSGSSDEYCCQETCIKCLKANGDKPVTVFSGTVINGKSEQGVDVLVPSSCTKPGCCCSVSSNYSGIHPASNDVLTALLLALPPETWSGIKNEKLLQEISSLVLTENLPTLLQEEVIN
jgi:glutathione gamma-glutamylcysteinyltransferase